MNMVASKVIEETAKVVVGREDETRLIMECLLAKGHTLIEGVPGVSKTLLAKSFARALGLDFRRIQFTPDMLPLDVVGGFVYNQGKGEFEFRKGPVFTQILLADEVNRAPPKVQSALLEAMQELQVTVEGFTEALPTPMMVLGTQNPVEFQGVYPLPEGQLDRFMMRVNFDYQPVDVETKVLRRNLAALDVSEVNRVVSPGELDRLLGEVQKVSASEELLDYLSRLAARIRSDERVELGPSPRAMVQLLHCARARALLDERRYVTPDDVKTLASEVLTHRLTVDRAAALKGVSRNPEAIVTAILDRVEPPR